MYYLSPTPCPFLSLPRVIVIYLYIDIDPTKAVSHEIHAKSLSADDYVGVNVNIWKITIFPQGGVGGLLQ